MWWVKRKLEREQLSALPPALQIRKQVETVLARIWTLRREADVRAEVAAINAEIARVNRTTTAGPATSAAPLDPERIVARWREVARDGRP